MPERIVKVGSVSRDHYGIPMRVQIKYFKDGELLHDAVFVREGKGLRKIPGSYIPESRFIVMIRKAAAVMFDKRLKPARQPELPLKRRRKY